MNKMENRINRRDFIKKGSKLAIIVNTLPFTLGCEGLIGMFNESNQSKERALRREFEESQKPIIGIIISRYHNGINLEKNPEYNGWVSYSNETVKLGSSIFVFGMRTISTKKLLSVSVLDTKDRKKESLIPITRKGSKVIFPQGNLKNWTRVYFKETYFRGDTQAGRKRVDRIKVLEY